MITDLGILEPDPETKELTLTRLHPGATVEAARRRPAGTSPSPTTPARTEDPTAAELTALRELIAR